MSGRFRTSNPVMDGIEAFGAVDNIFRRRRQDERQTALDARNAAWEDEQRGAWRDDRGRADEARKTKAEIYRLEQEFYSQAGRYTTEYFDPEKRAQHKELLSEGMARLDSGKIDDNFFIQYANSIYHSQINRGTGGSKSIAKFKPGPDGKSIVVGLNVTDNSGRSRMEMMTKNRGTREEGDNEVKTVPISGLVQDNIKRQILIDTLDEHGVGVGTPEEQRGKIEQALTAAKARLLELGDTSIAERDQGLAAEARNYQQQLDLSDRNFALGTAKDAMGHRRALQLEGMRHRNAVALKGVGSQSGAGGGVGGGDNKFLSDAKMRYTTKTMNDLGNVVEQTDWNSVNEINDFRMAHPEMRSWNFDEIEPYYRQYQTAVDAQVGLVAQGLTTLIDKDIDKALEQASKMTGAELNAVYGKMPKESVAALSAAAKRKKAGAAGNPATAPTQAAAGQPQNRPSEVIPGTGLPKPYDWSQDSTVRAVQTSWGNADQYPPTRLR